MCEDAKFPPVKDPGVSDDHRSRMLRGYGYPKHRRIDLGGIYCQGCFPVDSEAVCSFDIANDSQNRAAISIDAPGLFDSLT